MALTSNPILYKPHAVNPYNHLPVRRPFLIRPSSNSSWSLPRTSPKVSATKKFSARTGRFDSKNKKSSTTVKEEEEERTDDVGSGSQSETGAVVFSDDGVVMPELPGAEPDFWEGPQWEPLGFFVQYLWAFGVVFGLIACGIAAFTYNNGATDFRDTPVYKESVQSREDLLEEPDSDVFEANPTEDAPSLE